MSVSKISTVQIDCGIKGEVSKDASRIFFPVFKVEFLHVNWKPADLQNEFSICFTSKHAVKAFKLNILPLYSQSICWRFCHSVCAVGESTALFAEQQLPSYLYEKHNIIYPKKANGLFALLSQMKNSKHKVPYIVIFTSQIGKAIKIVNEISFQNNIIYDVIPLYTLKDTNEKQTNDFLRGLFQEWTHKKEIRFIFYCRSRQIINCTVKLLMNYFNVTTPGNLPENIFFSPWENSAHQALLELNLFDRLVS